MYDRSGNLLWTLGTSGQVSHLAVPRGKPLKPGETYGWRVTAYLPQDSSNVTGANEPVHSPRVRFRVLSDRERRRVLDLSRPYARIPTVLAALYQREGLYYEAEQTLKELTRQNPHSELAKRVLKDLDDRARGAAGAQP